MGVNVLFRFGLIMYLGALVSYAHGFMALFMLLNLLVLTIGNDHLTMDSSGLVREKESKDGHRS